MPQSNLDIPIGAVVLARDNKYKTGHEWIYMGCRVTTVGTIEHWFAQFVAKRFGSVFHYKASSIETLNRKFSDLRWIDSGSGEPAVPEGGHFLETGASRAGSKLAPTSADNAEEYPYAAE